MRFPTPSCTEADNNVATWPPPWPQVQNGWVHDDQISCADRLRQILAKIPAITKQRLSETGISISTQYSETFGGGGKNKQLFQKKIFYCFLNCKC